mmetsp:Transcript_26210/g.56266  ORF Transcript_26210/g.56266 Transcript_26210/m.56266 type:complete len:1177 (+) Transcript_26210:411-3941(+)
MAPSWGSIDIRQGTFDYGEVDHNPTAAAHHYHYQQLNAGYNGNGSGGGNVITPAQTFRKTSAAVPPANSNSAAALARGAGPPGPAANSNNNYYMYPPSSPIKMGPSPKASPTGSPRFIMAGTGGDNHNNNNSPRQSPKVEPDDNDEEEDHRGAHQDGRARGNSEEEEEGLTAAWLPPQSTNPRVRPASTTGGGGGANNNNNGRVVVPTAVHFPTKPYKRRKPQPKVAVRQEAQHPPPQPRAPLERPSRDPKSAPANARDRGTTDDDDDAPPRRPPLVVDSSRSHDSSESPGHSLLDNGGRIQLVGGGIGAEWDHHPASRRQIVVQSSGGGTSQSLGRCSSRSLESGTGGGGSNEWEPPRPNRMGMVFPPGRPPASAGQAGGGSTAGVAKRGVGAPMPHEYNVRHAPHPSQHYGWDYYNVVAARKGVIAPQHPHQQGAPGGMPGGPPGIQQSSSSHSSGSGRSNAGAYPPHHPGYPPSGYSPERPVPPPRSSSAGYPGYPPRPGAGAAAAGYGYPGYPGYHPPSQQYPPQHHPSSQQYPPQHPYHSQSPQYPHQGAGPPGSSYPGAHPQHPRHPPPGSQHPQQQGYQEEEDEEHPNGKEDTPGGSPAPHPLLQGYNPHCDGMEIRPQFQNVKKCKATIYNNKRTAAISTAVSGSASSVNQQHLLDFPAGPNGALSTPRRRRRRNPTEKAAAAAAMAAAAEAALKERREKIQQMAIAKAEAVDADKASRKSKKQRVDFSNGGELVGGGGGGQAEILGSSMLVNINDNCESSLAHAPTTGIIDAHTTLDLENVSSPFSEEELKTLGSGDDEDIPAAKRAAMASQVALRAAAGGSPLEPPKSAKEVQFDIANPPSTPVCPPSDAEEPVLETATLMTENDVLCGRGGGTNSQMGNRRYRALVRDFQPTYLMAKRREKPRMARSVVLIVRHRGGRFLRRDDKTGRLYEVGDEKAEAKTSQALREGLDVRATKTAANTLMGGHVDKEGGKKRKAAAAAAVVTSPMMSESPRVVKASGAERLMQNRPQPVHAPGYGPTSRPTRPPPPAAAAGYYHPYPRQRYDDPYYRSRYPPNAAAAAAAATVGYEYGGSRHPQHPQPSAAHHPHQPPTAHHHYHHYAGAAGAGAAAGGYHYPTSYGGGEYPGAGGATAYPSPPRSSPKTTRDKQQPHPQNMPIISHPRAIHP